MNIEQLDTIGKCYKANSLPLTVMPKLLTANPLAFIFLTGWDNQHTKMSELVHPELISALLLIDKMLPSTVAAAMTWSPGLLDEVLERLPDEKLWDVIENGHPEQKVKFVPLKMAAWLNRTDAIAKVLKRLPNNIPTDSLADAVYDMTTEQYAQSKSLILLFDRLTEAQQQDILHRKDYNMLVMELGMGNYLFAKHLFSHLPLKDQQEALKGELFRQMFEKEGNAGVRRLVADIVGEEHFRQVYPNLAIPDKLTPPVFLTDLMQAHKDAGETLKRIKRHPQFNEALYAQILPLITLESRNRVNAQSETAAIPLRAAKLATLFDDYEEIMTYLKRAEKGYGAGKSEETLHDATLFEIPEGSFNAKHWREQTLNYGPAASCFVGIADKIESYAREHGLPLPEKPKEIATIAKEIAYTRCKERPDFAFACTVSGIPEKRFNRMLDLLNGELSLSGDSPPVILKTKSNIPAITIDGADIGHPGYVMMKLDVAQETEAHIHELVGKGKITDREMALILGELSYCCQSIGKAGEPFVLHGMTSENGDFYVWKKRSKDKADRIIAQSWVWRADEEKSPNTIVFDSIESLGKAYDPLFQDFMLAFAQKAKAHGIEHVHVGKGGKTPALGFEDAEPAARLPHFNFGTLEAEHDSREQYRVAKPNDTRSTGDTLKI